MRRSELPGRNDSRGRRFRSLAYEPLERREVFAAIALDTAFGSAGLTQFSQSALEVAEGSGVAADGKIVVATNTSGNYSVLRFTAAGSQDATFGTNGRVNLTNLGIYGSVVAIQANGKVLVGGQTQNADPAVAPDGTLARLNADGSLDTLFGVNGKLTLPSPVGVYDKTSLIRVMADGSILAVTSDNFGFALQHVFATGQIDTAFGGAGRVEVFTEGGYIRLVGLQVLSGGRIQFVGQFQDAVSFENQTWIGTLLADGSLDTSFGDQGAAVLESIPYQFDAQTAAWQSDGSILVGGNAYDPYPGTEQFGALIRATPAGVLDPAFAIDGLRLLDGPNAFVKRSVTSLHVLPDNRFIATEWVLNVANVDMQVSSFTANGSLESQFGGGTKTFAASSANDLLVGAYLLDPTRLLMVGATQTVSGNSIFLAKAFVSELGWQNHSNPLNVDNDPGNYIVPLDALIIINTLNDTVAGGARYLGPVPAGGTTRFYDVNGDDYVTALDALIVINWLNSHPPDSLLANPTSGGEGEASAGVAPVDGLGFVAHEQDQTTFDPAGFALFFDLQDTGTRRRP